MYKINIYTIYFLQKTKTGTKLPGESPLYLAWPRFFLNQPQPQPQLDNIESDFHAIFIEKNSFTVFSGIIQNPIVSVR